ncbi:hypothetical protein HKCCE4037_06395 [Rhodobacterales bacterium HKCCE4037]|nr:hypothetical protein [Rhodobacterales bacterium HKCCE4037]
MSWWGDLVGAPFEDGGRGPVSFDCWGLVRHVYAKQLGLFLPDHDGVAVRQTREIARRMDGGGSDGLFRQVAAPRALDVALMTAAAGSQVAGHVGVMVDETRVLHIWRGTDACVMRLSDYRLRGRVLGFYRHVQRP